MKFSTVLILICCAGILCAAPRMQKKLQLPDFMLLEKITSRTLLVRLVPDKL